MPRIIAETAVSNNTRNSLPPAKEMMSMESLVPRPVTANAPIIKPAQAVAVATVVQELAVSITESFSFISHALSLVPVIAPITKVTRTA